jgi:hypothetical protein
VARGWRHVESKHFNPADPNADRINWIQMATNAAAWIGLIATWPYIKTINRQTAARFDETLAALRKRSRGWN